MNDTNVTLSGKKDSQENSYIRFPFIQSSKTNQRQYIVQEYIDVFKTMKKNKGMIHSKLRLVLPLIKGRRMGSQKDAEGFKRTNNIVFLELNGG